MKRLQRFTVLAVAGALALFPVWSASAADHAGVVGNGVLNYDEFATYSASGYKGSLGDWPAIWADDSNFTNNSYFNTGGVTINDNVDSVYNARVTYAVTLFQNAGPGGATRCFTTYGTSTAGDSTFTDFGASAYQNRSVSYC